MARNLTPAQAAEKWANNLGAATANIRSGVLAVTTSPTEKAAAQAQAYVAGVQRAVTEGRWQAGLRRVTLQQWQQAMIDKGLPVIAQRAQLAKAKFQRFMQRWLAFQQTVRAQLESMPRGTLEQNIQRAVFVMRQNNAFKTQGAREAVAFAE